RGSCDGNLYAGRVEVQENMTTEHSKILNAALRGVGANKKTPLFDERKFRASVPPEMLEQRRWVRYFLKPKPEGGTAKIPLGNHSDPATWSTFDEAVAALEQGKEQGLGYCFLGGEIQALDVDHCRNP